MYTLDTRGFYKGHYKDFIEATVETVHKKQNYRKNDNETAKMKQTNKVLHYL